LQVNLIGHPAGLGFQETRDLWIQADADANGVLDYEEFKVHYIHNNLFYFPFEITLALPSCNSPSKVLQD
jgi:hypothetical protein